MIRLSQILISILFAFQTFGTLADESVGTSGEWVKKGYEIRGAWSIAKNGEKTVLSFNDEFKTKSGPDLKVYLSTKSIDQIKGRDVVKSSVLVSPLKSAKGAQQYELPADVDIDDFSSVLIHCEAYAHLWGGADLD